MAPCLNITYDQLYSLFAKKSDFIKRNLKKNLIMGHIDKKETELIESQPEESET